MSALAETLTPSVVEVGKIKIGCLGPPRQTSDGRSWRPPVKLDHFVITTLYRDDSGQLIVDQPLMDSLAPYADKRDGKLRSIPIMFPSNAIDDIMQSTHVWYVGKKCGARRAGKQVTFFFDPTTGLPLAEPKTGSWTDAYLDALDPTDKRKQRKLFKRFTTLNVMLGAGLARWGGLYKFRSCGEISARQLYGSLLVLRRAAAGVLRGPIFRLVVRPMDVSPDGISTKVHVVHCEYVSNDPSQLLQQARTVAELEAATATAVAESDRQYKHLLAAAVDEVPDDDEVLDLAFAAKPAGEKAEGEVGTEEMQPAPAIGREDFAALIKQKGWLWAKVTIALNRNWKTDYKPDATWSQVDPTHLNDFAAWLRTKPDAKADPETKAAAPDLHAEVERLAVAVAGSWENVRKEYAEALGFTGSRVKDLSPDQAAKLRDQLMKDLAAKQQAAA